MHAEKITSGCRERNRIFKKGTQRKRELRKEQAQRRPERRRKEEVAEEQERVSITIRELRKEQAQRVLPQIYPRSSTYFGQLSPEGSKLRQRKASHVCIFRLSVRTDCDPRVPQSSRIQWRTASGRQPACGDSNVPEGSDLDRASTCVVTLELRAVTESVSISRGSY